MSAPVKILITFFLTGAIALIFLFFGLYSMQIEDTYGDNQEVFYQSSDGDIILNHKTKQVGVIYKNWSSMVVISANDTLNISGWWNDPLILLRPTRKDAYQGTQTYSRILELWKEGALKKVLELRKELNTTQTNQIKKLTNSHEIPENGEYEYDISFAEWEGKLFGEKVIVLIKNDSVKIVYDGDGKLWLTKKGEAIDSGLLRKHKSGVWIITQKESDVGLEEIGGCTSGLAIIDFKRQLYWMC